MNAPYRVMFVTRPESLLPTRYRSSMASQGSGRICLSPREIRPFSRSNRMTFTFSVSPTLHRWDGWPILP